MKKYICLALSIFMLVTLSACANKRPSKEISNETNQPNEVISKQNDDLSLTQIDNHGTGDEPVANDSYGSGELSSKPDQSEVYTSCTSEDHEKEATTVVSTNTPVLTETTTTNARDPEKPVLTETTTTKVYTPEEYASIENASSKQVLTMTGIVKEVNGSSIDFAMTEGNKETLSLYRISGADKYNLKLKIGDKIKVSYIGPIMESYPMQFTNIVKIEKI